MNSNGISCKCILSAFLVVMWFRFSHRLNVAISVCIQLPLPDRMSQSKNSDVSNSQPLHLDFILFTIFNWPKRKRK